MTLTNAAGSPSPGGLDADRVLERVTRVLAVTLGIEDRLEELMPGTQLLDSLPELDSMAIIDVILATEEAFGIEIDETEITGDVFESIGSLASFVHAQVGTATG